ncbi:MAG: hypothetical protein KJI71_02800 [Patescibacteria group bacterium]|nr:hypothetical protein [Patescibacteria group bacterium]
MTITDRQGNILERIIKEYINSAQPVGSKLIEEKYDFGVSPATIRSEMQRMTDLGLLYQPHTSAGRIPTDKAYRFFVNNLLEEEVSEFKNIFEVKEIFGQEGDIFKLITDLSKFLAMTSSNLATIHLFKKDFFWKEGWEEILKEPEFEKKDFVFNFTKLLNRFEKDIKDFEINSNIKIYIGNENPFSKIKDFSIISCKCFFPGKEEGIISLIGPKRMAYGKNISLINSIVKVLEDY